jgi:hypothetical protein
MNNNELFSQLSFYTLSHSDKETFIHQHIVDAYTAQTADSKTKTIAIVYSLVGLYLFIEKKYTGKQVQLTHLKLSKDKSNFPHIILPEKRGEISISNVLAKKSGKERDIMIQNWCSSVWLSYYESKEKIEMYLIEQKII